MKEMIITCGGGDSWQLVGKNNTPAIIPNLLDGPAMTCESLRATNTYKIAREVFKWIQIIAPIMLVIFGMIDFIKPILASDTDAIKKAQGAFVKIIIIVAAIILLPFILDFLLSLLDSAMGNDISTCGLGKN